VSRFQFVGDHRDTFGVKRLCRVLAVSGTTLGYLSPKVSIHAYD
jgi:hypothetical protein